VRACGEVQGTFALTIDGRGFASMISAGRTGGRFLSSECVSCGACVQACPTATLQEKAVKEIGKPERAVITTCAYCGVGCTFRAEMRGEQLVRMVPWKDGKANRGHSCVKGRFAWGYANHQDRITTPMIRDAIDQPWREVSWAEAMAFTADRLNASRRNTARARWAVITSSRCTNEETYLVQKLVRARVRNNNVDTCARVCHSPTGYGLSKTFGTSAGTQDFDSVDGRRRDPGDRRQPDRRASGLRQPDEAPPAAGREADRHRPAPDRPCPFAPYRGGAPPARCSPAPMSRC
jgi:formate dehydrogenase major subunit